MEKLHPTNVKYYTQEGVEFDNFFIKEFKFIAFKKVDDKPVKVYQPKKKEHSNELF